MAPLSHCLLLFLFFLNQFCFEGGGFIFVFCFFNFIILFFVAVLLFFVAFFNVLATIPSLNVEIPLKFQSDVITFVILICILLPQSEVFWLHWS